MLDLPTFIFPEYITYDVTFVTIQVNIVQTITTLSVATFMLHSFFLRHKTCLTFFVNLTHTFECFLGWNRDIVLYLYLFPQIFFHFGFFLFSLNQMCLVAIFTIELSVTFFTCDCRVTPSCKLNTSLGMFIPTTFTAGAICI